MHSSIIVSALVAAVAFASPLAEPAVTTEVSYVTHTEVVKYYVDAAAETPAPEPQAQPARQGRRYRYYWHHGGDKAKTSSTTVTEAVTAESTVEASSSAAIEAPAQEQSSDRYQPVSEPTQSPEPTLEQSQAPAPETTQEQYQPPAPETTAEAAPVQSQSSGSGGSYKQALLDSHNIHRANHSAPALEWDDELESIAKEIGSQCHFKHFMGVRGVQYGQNLDLGTAPENIGDAITMGFYNHEVMNYPGYGSEPDTGTMADKKRPWGHFSQMVWKDVNKLGCFTTDCASRGVLDLEGNRMPAIYTPFLTVCNYKGPNGPGNFRFNGEGYAKNVLPPLGHPMVAPW